MGPPSLSGWANRRNFSEGRNIALTPELVEAMTQHPSLFMFSHCTEKTKELSVVSNEVVAEATQNCGWSGLRKCPMGHAWRDESR